VLERWTRAVLRFRVAVLASWLLVVGIGAWSAAQLPPLLANSLAVPGTDSERARTILRERFHEPDDGVFTVVFPGRASPTAAEQARLERRLAKAARAVPTGRAGELRDGGTVFADIQTSLSLPEAKNHTDELRAALRAPGERTALVTGQPAIQRDLDRIFASDLRRGELIAIAVALVALLLVLGLTPAVVVPFAVAACTIAATLAAVFVVAHGVTMVTYVTNVVALIGFALAVDYSLLIVFRFREEVAQGGAVEDAVVRTMATAGRAVVVSGLAVALGLALLMFVPVPLIRSLGIGGLLIPLASIAAALTLQPVFLSLLGARGVARYPSRARALNDESGGWARLARTVMRRPLLFLTAGTAVLVAAALPVLALELTPGSISAIPRSPESVRGYELLRKSIGPGGITPIHAVVDGGAPEAAREPGVRRAVERLADLVFRDDETKVVASGPDEPFVDRTDRYARVIVAGRHEFGEKQSQHFVERLRSDLVPRARFPGSADVVVGGAPAQGLDFLHRAYGAFPWLVGTLLALTYVVLLRAFRSLLLPLKAVLLNLLSVAAAYGLLVVIFRWDVGSHVLGLRHADEIEGWIPIVLFAVLFGISMDYEVFLVSRMREAWDELPDNARAVAHGLQRTGRVVTAAAAIMVGAFSGFAAGDVAALQQFGVWLMIAVVIDATIVRAVLLPALMTVLGPYNWWLPAGVARVVRVAPSSLVR
jgi:RND superfamily putative drug exporter